MKKFEYKVLVANEEEMFSMDSQGAEGWELVTITEGLVNGQLITTFYFKREIE